MPENLYHNTLEFLQNELIRMHLTLRKHKKDRALLDHEIADVESQIRLTQKRIAYEVNKNEK